MNASTPIYISIVSMIVTIVLAYVTFTRMPHQNQADDGEFIKNLAATADITTAARLTAEKRIEALEKEIKTQRIEYEKDKALLQEQIAVFMGSQLYEMTVKMRLWPTPFIEEAEIEYHPERRKVDGAHVPERRMAAKK
jgi:hypothetical protein